jgi:hypothetical protein
MFSVADRLREEDRHDERLMAPSARVRLALALGSRDLETFREARRIDAATASRLLDRRRQSGRRPSACLTALIG